MTKNISFKDFVIMALTVAALIGVIYSFPDVRFVKDSGSLYKGIGPIGFVDETVYLGRMNAIQKGDHSLRNPAIYEHRNDPVIMPAFPEFIEAGLGKLFGLDVVQTDMLATFILPAALYFLITLLAYQLSGSVFGSLAASFAVLLGMHFFSGLFLLSGKIFNLSYNLPLWFARPITPQMHFIFFISALYFIYRSLQDGKLVSTILGGIFLGSLFYVSVFYWVYTYTVIGVLFLIFVFKRDILTLKNIAMIGVIATAVSVPYWMENLKTMHDPNYNLLLYRFNIGFTHKAILPMGAVITLLLVYAARKLIISAAGKKALYFMSSMMLAIIITMNQQIMTGKLFKLSHWTTYTGKFAVILCAVISASLLLKYLFDKNTSLRGAIRLFAALFFAALLVHGLGMQMNYHVQHLSENLDMQGMAGAFKWLKSNAAKDAVVLSSPNQARLSEILPIYTNSFVYYSEPFFCLSLIPAEETRYRMLASYRLFDFTPDQAKSYPYSWDGAIFLTSDTNREKSFIDNERAKLEIEYRAMLYKDPLELVRRYKVDYILAVDGRDAAVIDKLVGSGHKKVYDDGRYSIIKVGGSNG
jgi:hypothetical protein